MTPRQVATWAVSSLSFLSFSCGPVPAAEDAAPIGQLRQATTVAGDYSANAVFLSHAYVTTASTINTYTNEFLTQMRARGVRTVHVNVGTLDATGRVPSSAYPQLIAFLNKVSAWENANGYSFQVYAWLSGSLDPASASKVDISTGTGNDRATILSECERFLSATASGSYVAGAQRAFDGVNLDLEPSGPLGPSPGTADDTNFNNWKTLMQTLRTQLNSAGLSSKLTGVVAHKWGDADARTWYWPQRYFYYMARYVNHISLNTYNSASASESAYEAWTQNNVRQALRSVSGVAYGNPALYPPPTNGVKLFPGFPAYPTGSSHDPAVETVPAASRGTDLAVSALVDDLNDASENQFGGAGMYLHTTGYAAGGSYARYDSEWAQWNTWWLGL